MPTLVHKSIPDVTLVVTDEVVESMKGSWDVEAPKPKTTKAASKK
jgi:hypothetical protein